jgi:hypothetical protein
MAFVTSKSLAGCVAGTGEAGEIRPSVGPAGGVVRPTPYGLTSPNTSRLNNPRGKPAYDNRMESGWSRRGLLDWWWTFAGDEWPAGPYSGLH